MKLLKSYFNPTPKKWRIFGDSLLSASMLATSYTIVKEDHRLAILFLAAGVIGKFITNFASSEKK